jgi:metal-sulfur cluster biosynthetic enzyme
MTDIEITDPQYGDKIRLLQMISLVRDPELDLNIVDLGLIYEIDINNAAAEIKIIMTLSTRACPAGDYIKAGVELMAKAAFKDYRVHVEITFEPEWSADMISAEGRQELGW